MFCFLLWGGGANPREGKARSERLNKGPRSQPAEKKRSWNLNPGFPLQGQCPFRRSTQSGWRHSAGSTGDGKPNLTGPWGMEQEMARPGSSSNTTLAKTAAWGHGFLSQLSIPETRSAVQVAHLHSSGHLCDNRGVRDQSPRKCDLSKRKEKERRAICHSSFPCDPASQAPSLSSSAGEVG